MKKETTIDQAQGMAFEYWANNEFKGFYSDSFGTPSMQYPKIYGCSESQIEVIRKNVHHSIERMKEGGDNIGDLIRGANKAGGALLSSGVRRNENKMASWGDFELRIVKCPYYKNGWDYPTEEIDEWKGLEHDTIGILRFTTK